MKRLVIVTIFILFAQVLTAQGFERQIGLRLGTTPGINGKVILNKKTAIHAILGFRKGGVQLYTLLEAYRILDKSSKQNWYMYFGGGAHIGYINGYNRIRRWSNTSGYYWEEERVSGPAIGLDAIFGVEYNITDIPLALFFEFKPMVEFQGFNRIRPNFWDSSIGIVYKINN